VSRRFLTIAFAACLFLLILSAKWATFDRFGSPMPDWDQWDAEGDELLVPWLQNAPFLPHLFHPQNEHRVILTKLQNLTLTLLNGQWDARVEAAANAVLHALVGAALWVFGRRHLTAAWHAPLFVIVFALFGLPFAWQNVLGGFHSQQYWLVGLSLAAMATLPFARAWSGAWWLGAFSAILVLGSMGSVLLAAAVVLALISWRCLRGEVRLRDAGPTLGLAAVIVAFGLITRLEVPWHDHMKAKTVSAFLLSAVHSLQWPWRDHDWLAAVLWLPWVIAGGWVMAWPRAAQPAEAAGNAALRTGQIIAALGGWVLVQVAATAYARGGDAGYPASRYMDTLAFGAAANALALGWLLTLPAPRRLGRVLPGAIALAWVPALGLGLNGLIREVLGADLVGAKTYYVNAERNLRRYLATNDPKHLASPDIPYPSAESLVERLANPTLRALMPVPLRTPLRLAPATTNGNSVFLENDARRTDPKRPPRLGLSATTPALDFTTSWGSFAANGEGARATGEWQSRPVTVTRRDGWLRFETAGHLGEPGVALELRDAATGAVLEKVIPSKVSGDSWRSADVPNPGVPFVVVARDQDPARWFAFSGPVEMGPLSYWAWQANKHGRLLFFLTAGVTVLLGAVTLLPARRQG
jgi:hypothetical protein